MASVLKVDKLDPQSGTALELGTSGDTVTVPSGVGLTLTDSTLLLPTTITSTTEVKTNKISPATGVAFTLGDSGDTFTVPSGATIANSGTATGFGITQSSFLPYANPLIINGDAAVAQRSTSVTGITGDSYNTCDRWYFRASNGGTWTQTQEALTADEAYEDGFSTALKMDCTTADASLGAGDYMRMMYKIEAQDLQLLKFGSSTAEKLTVAFWVKSTKTGTFILELFQEDDARTCSQSYTIDATDTWEFKILNYPADTTGVIDNNNGTGIEMNFWMGAGTTYTSGTLNETWNASVSANRAVGQVNEADSTSNNFHITGLQWEVGEYTSSDLPPFRHESYGDNLQRCSRYYQIIVSGGEGAGGSFLNFTSYNGAGLYCSCLYPMGAMRATPTMIASDNATDFKFWTASNSYEAPTVAIDQATQRSAWITANTSGGAPTQGYSLFSTGNNTTSRCSLTAEL